MEENERRAPLLGQDADRETFERVWRRVMPRPQDSPVRPGPRPEPPEPPRPGPPPRPEIRPPRPDREEDAALLARMMDGEAEDARFCRALARRAPEPVARILRAVAADEEEHGRRLGAAFFILTGRRRRPSGQGGGRPPAELWQGLREQYLTERREAQAYRRAAEGTRDESLRELFRALARDEERHAVMLRRAMEGR